jgi:hypothetical protein
MELLVGSIGADWQLTIFTSAPLPLAVYPPGAFLLAGLLFAAVQALTATQSGPTAKKEVEKETGTANDAMRNANP